MAIDGAVTAPSANTLTSVPGRVFTFLIGIAQSLPARAALGAKGFDEDEHGYAWSRLQALGELQGGAPKLDATVRNAVVELDAWDEPNFEAIRNALLRDHSEQASYLFENIEATQGPEAVLGVERLLGRLDALESGEGREVTRQKDLSAIALLAKRGYTAEERARLRALVEIARSVAPAPRLSDEDRQRLLLELYRWLSDWSAQARQCITSRSTLIRLGLAKRRRRATDTSEGVETTGSPIGGSGTTDNAGDPTSDDTAEQTPLQSSVSNSRVGLDSGASDGSGTDG